MAMGCALSSVGRALGLAATVVSMSRASGIGNEGGVDGREVALLTLLDPSVKMEGAVLTSGMGRDAGCVVGSGLSGLSAGG
jgi:hypothetical protein